MNTFADVIDALGGYREVAAVLAISPGTVSSMKTRNSIPPCYWPALIEAATARGVSGLTFETLARMAATLPPRAAPVTVNEPSGIPAARREEAAS